MKHFYFFFGILFFFACSENKAELRKLTDEEFIEMAVKNDFPAPDEVLIIGLDGAPISQDSLAVLESTGRYFEDFYADNNGSIVKVVVRPKTEVDDKNIARINQILKEGPEIIPTKIDCGLIPTLLDSVHNVDQANEKRRKKCRSRKRS